MRTSGWTKGGNKDAKQTFKNGKSKRKETAKKETIEKNVFFFEMTGKYVQGKKKGAEKG